MTQFGDAVSYTPATGGPAFPVVGVFMAPHEAIDVGAPTGISTTAPVLGVDLPDFLLRKVAAGHTETPPTQQDTLVREGLTYRVIDVKPDSEGGGLDLVLHRV